MEEKVTMLADLISKRRSIYPPQYNEKNIPDYLIKEVLNAANWAPNHKKTEPWRFKVIRGNALNRFSDYMGAYYKANTPEEKYSEIKYKRNKKKALQSNCIIAICMRRHPEEILPEWEEIAATAAAVQNMWLMCTALEIGAYWSSPSKAVNNNEFIKLEDGERCLGLFYMGYWDVVELESPRKSSIDEKTVWIED
ncbi:MAG: nitroreductase [Bacteroidota bacterium]